MGVGFVVNEIPINTPRSWRGVVYLILESNGMLCKYAAQRHGKFFTITRDL